MYHFFFFEKMQFYCCHVLHKDLYYFSQLTGVAEEITDSNYVCFANIWKLFLMISNLWTLFTRIWPNESLILFFMDIDLVTDLSLVEEFLMLRHDNEAKMADKLGYQVMWIHKSITSRYQKLMVKDWITVRLLSYLISWGNHILQGESYVNKIMKLPQCYQKGWFVSH